MRWRGPSLLALASLGIPLSSPASIPPGEVACAIRMRKVAEAAQAYRRLHKGAWPEYLWQLHAAGLLRPQEDRCPRLDQERASDSPSDLATSRHEGQDATSAYEYELAPVDGRRELKSVLLRRSFWEQVPVLRCQRHGTEGDFLNVTANGTVYTNPPPYWECLFLNDVPFTYRTPLLAAKRPTPPFSAGLPPRATDLPATALDLTPWCNAYPADPWWWGNDVREDGSPVPTLAALTAQFPNGHASIQGLDFDIRGLVQVGTCLPPVPNAPQPVVTTQYRVPCFPSGRKGFPIGKKADRILFLMGTVWEDRVGQETGRFTWHLANGKEETSPIIYGFHVARFSHHQPAPVPAWSAPTTQVLPAHLWLYEWRNPSPEVEVTSVDFLATATSPACPFIVGMSLVP